MATVSFDGANKRITISDTGDVTITAKEIYSRWKDWVLTNAQFEPAFRTFGGDPLGGGVFAGDYFFLNNDAGWRIKPEEKNHILTINGNLFAENTGLPIFVQTTGGYNVNIRQGYSSLTQTVSSGSGLSTEQNTKLDELHKVAGLGASPVITTQTAIDVADIHIDITGDGENITVLTRND